MIFRLTAEEIIALIAKHASKDHPELNSLDGKRGNITLISKYPDKFYAEIKVNEEDPNA